MLNFFSCVLATSANVVSQKLMGYKEINQQSMIAYGLFGWVWCQNCYWNQKINEKFLKFHFWRFNATLFLQNHGKNIGWSYPIESAIVFCVWTFDLYTDVSSIIAILFGSIRGKPFMTLMKHNLFKIIDFCFS